MRANIILCDHAALAEGKLYVHGGGWRLTGPGPTTMSIAVLVEVPWDRANSQISFELGLVHQDGNKVTQPSPTGEPLQIGVKGTVEVGRPPGITHGVDLAAPLALNFPPMMLPPGERFRWELKLDGEARDEWMLPFETRPSAHVAGETAET